MGGGKPEFQFWEERQAQEAQWEQKRVERKMTRVERRKLRRLEQAEQKLQSDMEAAPKFITMDNLDTEIEKLLNMRIDYNFAIDKQGNKFSADSTSKKDDAKDSEQKEAAKG
nr:hypothetical protein BaRGS_030980 [Batillaria attramentaria]